MNSSDRQRAFETFEIVRQATLKICNSSGQTVGTGFFVSSEGHFITCAHVVEDAGGIGELSANGFVAIDECYKGDRNKDDIALLRVMNHKSPVFLPLVNLIADQAFWCFGFSNETYKDGAPIEGKIVGSAISTDSTLFNQSVLRLVTKGDSQAIDCGQSGAAVCVYNKQKKRWEVVGVVVASESDNGGIALTVPNTVKELIPVDPNISRQKFTKIIIGFVVISLMSSSIFGWLSLRKCSDNRLQDFSYKITNLLKADGQLDQAVKQAEVFEKECPDNLEPLVSSGFVMLEKSSKSKSHADLQLAKYKFETVAKQTEGKNYAMAIYGLGLTLMDLGEHLEAIKQLKRIENIENDENLKIKIFYYIGYSYWALGDGHFLESEKYIKNTIQKIQNQGTTWNELNSNSDTFNYYQQSLRIAIDINEKLWYMYREDKMRSQIYYDKYSLYQEKLLRETIPPQGRKQHLDDLANSIGSQTGSIFFNITNTNDYKDMLCNFYKVYNVEQPAKLKSECKG